MIRPTHTYVTLDLSEEAYEEIRSKLEAAGYEHAFMPGGEIDMHGLAVRSSEVPELVVEKTARLER